jgi:hypothetical protein
MLVLVDMDLVVVDSVWEAKFMSRKPKSHRSRSRKSKSRKSRFQKSRSRKSTNSRAEISEVEISEVGKLASRDLGSRDLGSRKTRKPGSRKSRSRKSFPCDWLCIQGHVGCGALWRHHATPPFLCFRIVNDSTHNTCPAYIQQNKNKNELLVM